MILKKRYVDINDTLRHLKIQVIDSLSFAELTVPRMANPRDLWDYLKPRLHYENDPKGVELLQTMQTLFKNGGYGDCDCFVITTLACCIAQGWERLEIVLVGRKKAYPVHIYTVIYWRKQRIVLDFTNNRFNFERPGYSYIQELPVKWKNWNL